MDRARRDDDELRIRRIIGRPLLGAMALADLHGRRYDPADPNALLRHTPGGHPHNQLDHAGGRAKAAIRKLLMSAKSAAEVESVLKSEARRVTGRDISVSMSGHSPEIAREHAEGILQGLERFPRVPLTEVGRSRSNNYATTHREEADDVRIKFSDRWAKDTAKYHDSLKSDEETHWAVAGTASPVGVALHEFGHAVALSITDAGFFDARMGSKVRRKAETAHVHASSLAGQISDYAATNHTELVAEAFVDVMLNGDDATPLSREIFDDLVAAYKSTHEVAR